MKLAVLADIHANYIALETLTAHVEAWQPDVIIVAGDIVNRGPRPAECLQFVLDKQQTDGWILTRGNHEDYVISYDDPNTPRTGIEFEIYRTAYWTYEQLDGNVAAIEALPFQHSLTAPDGSEARITHASMQGIRSGIFPKTTDDELRHKIGAEPPVLLCVGHTHWPLIRTVDETLVVNVGSVGLPFDGDSRAAYGQLTWNGEGWQPEIIRLEYDVEAAERDFFDSGFMEGTGALAPLVLDELRTARPRLFRWSLENEAEVLAGRRNIDEAVRNFLEKVNS